MSSTATTPDERPSFWGLLGKVISVNSAAAAITQMGMLPFERARVIIQSDLIATGYSSAQQFQREVSERILGTPSGTRGETGGAGRHHRAASASNDSLDWRKALRQSNNNTNSKQPHQPQRHTAPAQPSSSNSRSFSTFASHRKSALTDAVEARNAELAELRTRFPHTRYSSIWAVLRDSYAEGGVKGVWKGGSLCAVSTIGAQCTGIALMMPLIISTFTQRMIPDHEKRLLASHLGAQAQGVFGFYPLAFLATRIFAERPVLPGSPADTASASLRNLVATNRELMVKMHPKYKLQLPVNFDTMSVVDRAKVATGLVLQGPLKDKLESIASQTGWKGIWRGMSMNAASILVYSGLYVPVYLASSKYFVSRLPSASPSPSTSTSTSTSSSLSSSPPSPSTPVFLGLTGPELATVTGPALLGSWAGQTAAYPFSTVRSCVIMSGDVGYQHLSPRGFTAAIEASRRIWKSHGLRGFYRGYWIVPMVRLPMLLTMFGICAAGVQQVWPKEVPLPNIRHHIQTHYIALP